MLPLINEGPALNTYKKYYSILDKTGYIKHSDTLRMLIYYFLIDFVKYTHRFFSEDDYNAVAAAMRTLFADGGCLLPFEVFCTNRAKLGAAEYMGELDVRKTEDLSGYEDRSTEDDILRVI